MLKKIVGSLILAMLAAIVGYGALVWHNNRSSPPPTREQIAAGWEKGVLWLSNNRQDVLRDRNPILWWMIGESTKLSGDMRLRLLFDEYRAAMNSADPDSVWQAFFKPEQYWGVSFAPEKYARYDDYQQYFLFGLTCSKQLAGEPVVIAQHALDFCRRTHPLSPACITHQMMGFRLAQRVGCDRVENLPDKIAKLQTMVIRQLRFDPRVVDVYLQRVLMLVDSGAPEKVRPRWLQRILDAQLADGSWSNLQPLFPIGAGRHAGFNEKLLGIGAVQGNLHATAQGIWLLSLLQQEQNYRALARE